MIRNLLATDLGRFRLLAFAEGLSFLIVLFVTMPLKYYFDQPQPNKIIGMLHGILFVGYCFYVLRLKWSLNWSWGKAVLLWLASVVPFGTFIADWKLLREETVA